MAFLKAALLVVIFSAVIEAKVSYDRFKVYDVEMQSDISMSFLNALEDLDGIDFWALPKQLNLNATVMASPGVQPWLEMAMRDLRVGFTIRNHDLEKTFEAERQHHRTTPKGSILQRYFRYDEILQFLDALEVKANKSSVNVTVKTIGRSFEGRDIKTVTISSGKGKANNSIFIDAGIHAREWIAVSTALYVIDQLASGNYSLQDLDWVILPVVNPDGYEYTHQSDRLWRKTRSNVSGECIGVDGNRNFDFHWAEVGASGFSCSETYRGEKAFSESETAALRDAVMSANDTCKLYLTLHSFGNYLLYPWGWTSDLPASWKDLHEVGESAANAMKEATGTSYTVGSSTNVLYAAAGGSDDYMFAKANIPFSYTMELSQGGHSGFDPPPSKIEGFVKESFIGIVKMAEEIAKRFK